MGNLFASGKGASAAPVSKAQASDELLHKLECRACPLNKVRIQSPKMEASGSKQPVVYMLGEAPGKTEDEEGIHFVGNAGEYLRPHVPPRWRSKVRWNNTIRCWPGEGNPDPTKVQLECCRPSIERDIEETKPDAIIGLGNVPLTWSGKPSGTELWRGRRFPIQIGDHICWYYVMWHPSFLLHTKKNNYFKSDYEVAFSNDMKKAFAEIEAGLPVPVVHDAKFARKDITCVTGRKSKDLDYVLDFLEYAATCDVAGVDYETQNLRPYHSTSVILTKAVSVANETLAFAYDHPRAGWDDSAKEYLKKAWIRFLKSDSVKAVHNLSFELEWSIVKYGADLARSVPWQCTQTQAYVLDERVGDSKPGAIALEFIALQYFGINIKKLTQGLNKTNMINEPLESLLPYNGIDAKYHRLCFDQQEQRIIDEDLVNTYLEKMAQIPSVVLTQIKGVPISQTQNKEMSIIYGNKLKQAEEKIQFLSEAKQFHRLTGNKFNPGSPSDVITLLRDILKTREGQPTDKGWSTKEEVLSKIKLSVTDAILEIRGLRKLKGTYIDPFSEGSPDLYAGSILHPHFGTTFTETGRLQSEDPNLQNIPIRTTEGKLIRKQFQSKGPTAGFDFGQIDARIIACGSRDKNYCKALWENYDIHMEWARRLAHHHPEWIGGKKNINDEKVMKDFRATMVKNKFVFALFYGAALKTTAGRFSVDEDTMRPMYEAFKKQFADVITWQEQLVKQFEEFGYVQLLGGQRRRAPLSKGQIVNSGVQNGTNRIVMNGMNRLSAAKNPVLQPNIQIHDDLTYFFNSERELEDNFDTILDTMLDGSVFDWVCVPLAIEVKVGPNWADAKDTGIVYNSAERLGWPIRAKEFM